MSSYDYTPGGILHWSCREVVRTVLRNGGLLRSRPNKRPLDITVAEGSNSITDGSGKEQQNNFIQADAEVVVEKGFDQFDNQVMNDIETVGNKSDSS